MYVFDNFFENKFTEKCDFISGICIVFHWSVCLLLCQNQYFLPWVVIYLKIRYCDAFSFSLFLLRFVSYLLHLVFYMF
jgi:hypothetical protein